MPFRFLIDTVFSAKRSYDFFVIVLDSLTRFFHSLTKTFDSLSKTLHSLTERFGSVTETFLSLTGEAVFLVSVLFFPIARHDSSTGL